MIPQLKCDIFLLGTYDDSKLSFKLNSNLVYDFISFYKLDCNSDEARWFTRKKEFLKNPDGPSKFLFGFFFSFSSSLFFHCKNVKYFKLR